MASLNDETRSIVTTLMGGLLIAITVSGQYTSYVKPGFAPLLVVSGIILAAMGAIRLVQAIRADRRHHAPTGPRSSAATPDEPDQDCHGHPSKTSWMLLAPILILLVAAPPALGADAVARTARSQAVAAGPPAAAANEADQPRRTMPFPSMPGGLNPELSLKEFVLRALYDETDSVATTPVTVTGFIAGPGQGRTDGYTVARVVINCCAADANPLRFYIAGEPPFPENTWVEVVVTAVPGTGNLSNEYVPEVTIKSLQPIDPPSEPYLT